MSKVTTLIMYDDLYLAYMLQVEYCTNRDRRYCACGNVMNFIIAFDQDDGTARCHLTTEAYGESSAEDAWVLFTTDI